MSAQQLKTPPQSFRNAGCTPFPERPRRSSRSFRLSNSQRKISTNKNKSFLATKDDNPSDSDLSGFHPLFTVNSNNSYEQFLIKSHESDVTSDENTCIQDVLRRKNLFLVRRSASLSPLGLWNSSAISNDYFDKLKNPSSSTIQNSGYVKANLASDNVKNVSKDKEADDVIVKQVNEGNACSDSSKSEVIGLVPECNVAPIFPGQDDCDLERSKDKSSQDSYQINRVVKMIKRNESNNDCHQNINSQNKNEFNINTGTLVETQDLFISSSQIQDQIGSQTNKSEKKEKKKTRVSVFSDEEFVFSDSEEEREYDKCSLTNKFAIKINNYKEVLSGQLSGAVPESFESKFNITENQLEENVDTGKENLQKMKNKMEVSADTASKKSKHEHLHVTCLSPSLIFRLYAFLNQIGEADVRKEMANELKKELEKCMPYFCVTGPQLPSSHHAPPSSIDRVSELGANSDVSNEAQVENSEPLKCILTKGNKEEVKGKRKSVTIKKCDQDNIQNENVQPEANHKKLKVSTKRQPANNKRKSVKITKNVSKSKLKKETEKETEFLKPTSSISAWSSGKENVENVNQDKATVRKSTRFRYPPGYELRTNESGETVLVEKPNGLPVAKILTFKEWKQLKKEKQSNIRKKFGKLKTSNISSVAYENKDVTKKTPVRKSSTKPRKLKITKKDLNNSNTVSSSQGAIMEKTTGKGKRHLYSPSDYIRKNFGKLKTSNISSVTYENKDVSKKTPVRKSSTKATKLKITKKDPNNSNTVSSSQGPIMENTTGKGKRHLYRPSDWLNSSHYENLIP